MCWFPLNVTVEVPAKPEIVQEDSDGDGFGDEGLLSLEAFDETALRWSSSVPPELVGKHVVSIGKKSGFRCLHLLGACHRVPGLHYADFQVFDTRPGEHEYQDHCKQCWPGGSPAAASDPAHSDNEGSSSSDDGSD